MTINEAIETYTRENAAAAAAKKAADAAKKIIFAAMGDGNELVTDAWTVYRTCTYSTTLDLDKLYLDFPDIKETYGKQSPRQHLEARAIRKPEEVTA